MSELNTIAGHWVGPVSWYQKIVLRMLAGMNKGKLNVLLPSGEQLVFGEKSSDVNTPIQATIQIRSPEFFKRCILYGDIGFGEAYTDGLWDTDNITQVIKWMILNTENNPGVSGSKVSNMFLGLFKTLNKIRHLKRENSLKGSQQNISNHYDLSNELFSTFLGSKMTYSSGDFSTGAQTLEDAQTAKFDRLAKAIQIKETDHVLEIGGGWGALAIHLAAKYGCKVTTITISKEQFSFMKKKVEVSGLGDKVEILFQDYRNTTGQYDKIISVEMLEAVGHKHLPAFFEVAERVLKPTGLMGVQVIVCADSRYEKLKNSVDWTQKHIFPGSLIPSVGALIDAAREKSSFQMFSLFDLGTSYAKTLFEWRLLFNSNLERIKTLGFDNRFIRTWNYYFGYCEAGFATRHISVVQIVYTHPDNWEIT